VLTPRSIWHGHSHENEKTQEQIKLSKGENSFHAEDCFICDFSLSLFTVHEEYSFFKYNFAVVPKPKGVETSVDRLIDPYFSLRGPPAFS
jgi:hypothetical protein